MPSSEPRITCNGFRSSCTTTADTATVIHGAGALPLKIEPTTVASAATRSTTNASARNAPRRKRRPGPKPPGRIQGGPPRIQGGPPGPQGGPCPSVIGEPIADAVDGQDVARVPDLGLDLPAEVLHVRIDRAVV